MTGRSHLSIGEVLSLLQEEFPDVTISKIRFLESQGLVDPERTPSGYRKFYEPDIERLRWVLRQQRDAFLPLKVIKGRLEGTGSQLSLDGLGDDHLESAGGGTAFTEALRAATGPAGDFEHGVVIHEVTVERYVEVDTELVGGRSSTPDPGAASGRAPEAGAAASRTPDAGAAASRPGVGMGPGPEAAAAAAAAGPNAAAAAGPAGGRRTEAGGHSTRAAGAQDPSGPSGPPDGRRSPGRAGTRNGAVPSAAPSPQVPAVASDELSLEELTGDAGVDVETVRDLERFGLVTPRSVAGVSYYSPDAVLIAQLAGAFARHGVEARHLRAYKGAAEREAGLVHQVIAPLVRQRNPEARQAAAAAVQELSQLGGELRAALLRSALSDLR